MDSDLFQPLVIISTSIIAIVPLDQLLIQNNFVHLLKYS